MAFELFADHSNVKLMFLITSNPVIETFVLDCLPKVSVPEVTDKENAVECVTNNTDDHSSVKQSSSAPANYIVGDELSIVFKKITKSVKISLYIKLANKLKRKKSFIHLAGGGFMSNYDYRSGKQRVIDILTSKTAIEEAETIPSNEDEFTYENGIKSWVGSLFVDIRNSTDYFKGNKQEIVSRVIRAFCSEIISILQTDDNFRQIGIRGDCVYGIFSTPKKSDLDCVLCNACTVNTFQKMFQEILQDYSMPTFEIGIGLGCSKDLVIKAGRKGTGINDFIWIGNAVIDACKLSSQGNKDGFEPIVMSECFYNNIKDINANKDETYSKFCNRKYSENLGEYVWHCNMVMIDFNNWINGGMK